MQEWSYQELSPEELLTITGGSGLLADFGNAVGKTWNTLYQTGRDFGRSLVHAIIP